MPTEVKEKCNMINSPSFVGYTRLGAETTAKQTDWREQFDFGTPGMKQWTPEARFGRGWKETARSVEFSPEGYETD